MSYNYAHFDAYVESGQEARDFGAFSGHLRVGGLGPDVVLTRLEDGQSVALSERWRERTVVAEFGSFT